MGQRRGFGTPTQKAWSNDALKPDTKLLEGTEEQNAVWEELLRGHKHVIVEAVAGSGKTTTLVQYALREKYKRIGIVAFNSHIAAEIRGKISQPNVEALTYHALGRRAVVDYARSKGVNTGAKTWVDEYKVLNYLDSQTLSKKVEGKLQPLDRDEQKIAKYRIKALVGYAKNYGFDETITDAELSWIEERHDVDLNGLRETVFGAVGSTLKWCKRTVTQIDFDDMVWIPYVLKLPVPKFDVLCVDEYQDTAITQQWLAIQSGVRLCAVGDSRQAIYAFRGADSKGFDRLRERLGDGVVTLPLTLTRRCPQAHVALAKTIVPQIRALDTAPQGIVRWAGEDQVLGEMRPGDLVVCRVNAPLLNTAYRLLKKGVRAVVRGRDIGEGIIKLLDKATKTPGTDLKQVLEIAATITSQEVSKFNAMPQGRGEMRAQAAQDKFDCLCELGSQVESVSELRSVLDRLFDDKSTAGCVVLGTVHRTKGLEGNRVYVLKPELLPHPMAKKAEDKVQELNLAYVVVTRAKFESEEKPGELVFVGGESALFLAPTENIETVSSTENIETVSEGGWE